MIIFVSMNKKQLQEIGALFNAARVNCGKSTYEIAERTDLSHTTIINAEKGNNMNVITLFKLMEYYGISFGKISKIIGKA